MYSLLAPVCRYVFPISVNPNLTTPNCPRDSLQLYREDTETQSRLNVGGGEFAVNLFTDVRTSITVTLANGDIVGVTVNGHTIAPRVDDISVERTDLFTAEHVQR